MMSFVMETTEDVGGSASDQYLSEPGTYHCVVTGVAEDEGPKGNPIDGFTVGLSVLDGTKPGQKDKSTNLCLFSPDQSKTEKSQEWARKKQTAFAIAAGLIDLKKLGGKVQINLQEAVGRQLVLTFVHDDEGKYLQLSYANIYHVDDPRAATFPKDKEALGIIAKELRKDTAYFMPLTKRGESTKTASKLSNSDLADL
jgi:hypothetical protein